MIIVQDVQMQLFALDVVVLIQHKEILNKLAFAKLQHGIMEEHALV
jgi:hypothetical protein